MNTKDIIEIRRGLAYFSLATAIMLFYFVIGRDDEGFYSICGAFVFSGGLLLYLAAGIAFFPLKDDDDE